MSSLTTGPILVPSTGNVRPFWQKLADHLSVRDFGAVGDGVTDDTGAFNRAISYLNGNGGGELYIPPTGKPYILTSGVSLPNGVVLVGSGARNFQGSAASSSSWSDHGSWVKCTDLTNPAVTLVGHGSGVRGVNFIYDQPTPSVGTPWTPTTYPYAIKATISWFTIADVMVVNGTHGIWVSYNSVNGGGTFTTIRNVKLGVFTVGLKTENVNDDLTIDGLEVRYLYQYSYQEIVDYMLANLIGWDCGYTDNPFVDNVQFFRCHTGILLTDGTCLGNTHSLYNVNVGKIQFNLVRYAIRVASSTTTATGDFAQVFAQGDVDNSLSDTLFLLNSDNVDFAWGSLRVPVTGGSIMEVGGGSFGKVDMGVLVVGQHRNDGIDYAGWSAVLGNQTGLKINTGAKIKMGARDVITPASSGAKFIGGGGADNGSLPHYEWIVTTVEGQVGGTATGSWVDMTGINPFRTNNIGGALQFRITGTVHITTPQVGGTMAIRLSNFGNNGVTGINASASGYVTFDSNWTENRDGNATLGTIQVNATSGVVFSFSSLSVFVR